MHPPLPNGLVTPYVWCPGIPLSLRRFCTGAQTRFTGVSDKAPTENPAGGSGSRATWVGPGLMSCEPSSPLPALEEETCLTQQTSFRKPCGSFLTQSKLPKQTGSSRHCRQTFQLRRAFFKPLLNDNRKSTS